VFLFDVTRYDVGGELFDEVNLNHKILCTQIREKHEEKRTKFF